MARGWNGFYVGDKIECDLVTTKVEGVIIHLYVRDKSKGRIKMENGLERDVILDSCIKINRTGGK